MLVLILFLSIRFLLGGFFVILRWCYLKTERTTCFFWELGTPAQK